MFFETVLQKLSDKTNLTCSETQDIFDHIFDSALKEEQIASFLRALHQKGETSEELLGAVLSMRSKALRIEVPKDAIDIVGTGGDAKSAYNISTAAAFIVAGCGVPVAKHGNRASTSKSGSSDVLAALGINLDASFSTLEKCIENTNLCFLFAPKHHPSMGIVREVRKKIGIRTIFNLLGPLTNPAFVKKHLIGVYDPKWLRPMAETLHSLGSTDAWITHGKDGMDELTTYTQSDVVTLHKGQVIKIIVSPNEVGLSAPDAHALTGGDAQKNADMLIGLLEDTPSPYRDIVLLNAAAALIVSGKANNLSSAMLRAKESLASGKARDTLKKVIEITNRAA